MPEGVSILDKLKVYIKWPILCVISALFISYLTHHITFMAYDYICIDHTWYGMLKNLITLSSPWCNLLFKISTKSLDTYIKIINVITDLVLSFI